MLTVDAVAKRYGVLPSQLLRTGDELDIHIAEISAGYERFLNENPDIKTDHGLSQEVMLDMVNRAKQR